MSVELQNVIKDKTEAYERYKMSSIGNGQKRLCNAAKEAENNKKKIFFKWKIYGL